MAFRTPMDAIGKLFSESSTVERALLVSRMGVATRDSRVVFVINAFFEVDFVKLLSLKIL